jgi:gamma-glutamyl-gamma-aminobutyrate hydrolase PuuD
LKKGLQVDLQKNSSRKKLPQIMKLSFNLNSLQHQYFEKLDDNLIVHVESTDLLTLGSIINDLACYSTTNN